MEEKKKTPAAAKTYRDLIVWQKAHAWVLDVYRYTKRLPDDERFGLIAQIRRAGVSVPSNIVEGFRRESGSDKRRFYNIAHASLDEATYQLYLSQELGYGDSEAIRNSAEEISRLLNAYIRKLPRTTR